MVLAVALVPSLLSLVVKKLNARDEQHNKQAAATRRRGDNLVNFVPQKLNSSPSSRSTPPTRTWTRTRTRTTTCATSGQSKINLLTWANVFSISLLLTLILSHERLVAPISCSPAVQQHQSMSLAAASAALASISAPVASGASISAQEMLIRLQPSSRGGGGGERHGHFTVDTPANSSALAGVLAMNHKHRQLDQRALGQPVGAGGAADVETTTAASGEHRPEVSGNSSSLQRYLERKNFGVRLNGEGATSAQATGGTGDSILSRTLRHLSLGANNGTSASNTTTTGVKRPLDYETTSLIGNHLARQDTIEASATSASSSWFSHKPVSRLKKLLRSAMNVSQSIGVDADGGNLTNARQYIIEPDDNDQQQQQQQQVVSFSAHDNKTDAGAWQPQESLSIGILIKPTESGHTLEYESSGGAGGGWPPAQHDSLTGSQSVLNGSYETVASRQVASPSDIEQVIHIGQSQSELDSTKGKTKHQHGLEHKAKHGERLKDHEESGFWRKEKHGENEEKAKQKHGGADGAKNLMDLGHNRHGWKNVYHKEEYAQHQKYHDVFRDKKWDHKNGKYDGDYQYQKGDKFNQSLAKDYYDKDKHGSQYDYQKGNHWKRYEDDHYDGGADDHEHEHHNQKERLASHQMQHAHKDRTPVAATSHGSLIDYRLANRPQVSADGSAYEQPAGGREFAPADEPDDEIMERMKANLERLSGQVVESVDEQPAGGRHLGSQYQSSSSQNINSHQNINDVIRTTSATGRGRKKQRRASNRQRAADDRYKFGRYVVDPSGGAASGRDHRGARGNDNDDDDDNDESEADTNDDSGDEEQPNQQQASRQQAPRIQQVASQQEQQRGQPNGGVKESENRKNELRLKLELDLGKLQDSESRNQKSANETRQGREYSGNYLVKDSVPPNHKREYDHDTGSYKNNEERHNRIINYDTQLQKSPSGRQQQQHKEFSYHGKQTGKLSGLSSRPIFVKHLQMNGGIMLGAGLGNKSSASGSNKMDFPHPFGMQQVSADEMAVQHVEGDDLGASVMPTMHQMTLQDHEIIPPPPPPPEPKPKDYMVVFGGIDHSGAESGEQRDLHQPLPNHNYNLDQPEPSVIFEAGAQNSAQLPVEHHLDHNHNHQPEDRLPIHNFRPNFQHTFELDNSASDLESQHYLHPFQEQAAFSGDGHDQLGGQLNLEGPTSSIRDNGNFMQAHTKPKITNLLRAASLDYANALLSQSSSNLMPTSEPAGSFSAPTMVQQAFSRLLFSRLPRILKLQQQQQQQQHQHQQQQIEQQHHQHQQLAAALSEWRPALSAPVEPEVNFGAHQAPSDQLIGLEPGDMLGASSNAIGSAASLGGFGNIRQLQRLAANRNNNSTSRTSSRDLARNLSQRQLRLLSNANHHHQQGADRVASKSSANNKRIAQQQQQQQHSTTSGSLVNNISGKRPKFDRTGKQQQQQQRPHRQLIYGSRAEHLDNLTSSPSTTTTTTIVSAAPHQTVVPLYLSLPRQIHPMQPLAQSQSPSTSARQMAGHSGAAATLSQASSGYTVYPLLMSTSQKHHHWISPPIAASNPSDQLQLRGAANKQRLSGRPTLVSHGTSGGNSLSQKQQSSLSKTTTTSATKIARHQPATASAASKQFDWLNISRARGAISHLIGGDTIEPLASSASGKIVSIYRGSTSSQASAATNHAKAHQPKRQQPNLKAPRPATPTKQQSNLLHGGHTNGFRSMASPTAQANIHHHHHQAASSELAASGASPGKGPKFGQKLIDSFKIRLNNSIAG